MGKQMRSNNKPSRLVAMDDSYSLFPGSESRINSRELAEFLDGTRHVSDQTVTDEDESAEDYVHSPECNSPLDFE